MQDLRLTGKPAAYRGVITDYGRSNWDPSGFQPGYFNIMPQDGFYECRCPECQKHFAKGAKDTSEFVWDFVCGTAEKLKKNNVPGYLTMMGYTPYRLIPERPIPDNVLIMVALAGPWTLHISAMYDKLNGCRCPFFARNPPHTEVTGPLAYSIASSAS